MIVDSIESKFPIELMSVLVNPHDLNPLVALALCTSCFLLSSVEFFRLSGQNKPLFGMFAPLMSMMMPTAYLFQSVGILITRVWPLQKQIWITLFYWVLVISPHCYDSLWAYLTFVLYSRLLLTVILKWTDLELRWVAEWSAYSIFQVHVNLMVDTWESLIKNNWILEVLWAQCTSRISST